MKKIISLIITLFSLTALAETIIVDGEKFEIKRMGKSYIAIPTLPTLLVKKSINGDHQRVFNVDCKEAEALVSKLSRRIERCTEASTSTSCKYTKERIFEYAKDNQNLSGSPDQFFKIQYEFSNKVVIQDKIAKELAVAKGLVKVQTELSSNFQVNTIDLITNKNSLMSRVSSLDLFKDRGLSEFYYNQYLRIDNRLLYCDIVSGDTQVQVEIKNEITHIEKIKGSTKEQGNKIYQTLLRHKISHENSKLVQAANIGFVLGSEIKKNQSNITISSLFKKIINVEHRNLELINFDNQGRFEEAVFPDQYFSSSIDQTFNVKFN